MNQTLTCCDAVRLEGAQRLTFLPDLFGGDFMTSEASVYAYAHRYCPEYQGGFWHFYRLPDGGGFMAPDTPELLLCNTANGFEQTVSGEVAGILLSSGGEVVRTLYQNDTLQPEQVSQLIAQMAGMRRFNCTARTVAKLMSGEVTA